MAWTTTTRINAVVVNGFDVSTDQGHYADPTLYAGGTYASCTVPIEGNPIATAGQLFRGMPAFLSPLTMMLCPPNASGAIYIGTLYDDVTQLRLARGTKIGVATRGQRRVYAGASMSAGSLVKPDLSTVFTGYVPWVSGTDAESLKAGIVFPLDDGSAENGASAAITIAAGDTVFLR